MSRYVVAWLGHPHMLSGRSHILGIKYNLDVLIKYTLTLMLK